MTGRLCKDQAAGEAASPRLSRVAGGGNSRDGERGVGPELHGERSCPHELGHCHLAGAGRDGHRPRAGRVCRPRSPLARCHARSRRVRIRWTSRRDDANPSSSTRSTRSRSSTPSFETSACNDSSGSPSSVRRACSGSCTWDGSPHGPSRPMTPGAWKAQRRRSASACPRGPRTMRTWRPWPCSAVCFRPRPRPSRASTSRCGICPPKETWEATGTTSSRCPAARSVS